MDIRFEYTNGRNKDFIQLTHYLDDFLNKLAGGEENRAEYIPFNKLNDIHDVIIAYSGREAVGCASFKRYDDECAEVKRVFIKKEYRGQRISIKLMEILEEHAKKKGFKYLILESGESLIVAMKLYKKIGYKVISNYGQYKNMHDSICMRKEI